MGRCRRGRGVGMRDKKEIGLKAKTPQADGINVAPVIVGESKRSTRPSAMVAKPEVSAQYRGMRSQTDVDPIPWSSPSSSRIPEEVVSGECRPGSIQSRLQPGSRR